jgi:hypothetical protein
MTVRRECSRNEQNMKYGGKKKGKENLLVKVPLTIFFVIPFSETPPRGLQICHAGFLRRNKAHKVRVFTYA